MEQKTENVYEKLIAPFTKEAYSEDNSRGFKLTSLRAQYVRERLNEVFGIFGWSFEEKFEEHKTGVLCHGTLTVQCEGMTRSVTSTGFSPYKKNTGDSYKGSSTDALSKCASFIGVGNEVFKGNINLNTVVEPETRKPQKSAMGEYPKDIYGVCPTCSDWLHLSRAGTSLYCRSFLKNKRGQGDLCGQKQISIKKEQLVKLPDDITDTKEAIKFFKEAHKTETTEDIPF